MAITREEVLAEIEEGRRDYGRKFPMWFNNFSLSTRGFYVPTGSRDLYRKKPELLDQPATIFGQGLRRTKTLKQFLRDVDRAFRDTGKFRRMMTLSKQALEDPEFGSGTGKTEEALAELYIEPYIRLRMRGYSREELI